MIGIDLLGLGLDFDDDGIDGFDGEEDGEGDITEKATVLGRKMKTVTTMILLINMSTRILVPVLVTVLVQKFFMSKFLNLICFELSNDVVVTQ